MKKIISLLLLILIIVSSLCSCDISSIFGNDTASSSNDEDLDDEDSETDDNDETDDSSTGETGDETGDVKNDFGPDAIDYSVLYDPSNPSILRYGLFYTFDAPSLTAYYRGCKAAVSFTFDDGYDLSTARYVSDTLGAYGYRATIMLCPSFIMDNDSVISTWRSILAEGVFDAGVHGYKHLNPAMISQVEIFEQETKGAYDYLKSVFPEQNFLTFATPYANVTSGYKEYLQKYYIANREAEGGKTPSLSEDYDKYNIYSYAMKKDTNFGGVNRLVDNAVVNGTWLVELYHRVTPEPIGDIHVLRSDFESHLEYINTNHADDVWVASFEEVSIYKEQLDNTTITYKAADKDSITFSLNCSLDSDIYNMPMTMKVYLPSVCDSAYVVMGDKELDVGVLKDNKNKKYINLIDCPIDGTDIKIYMGGNAYCMNGCTHYYDKIETVTPSCSQRGYTKITCSICGNSYYTRYKVSAVSHDFGEWKISDSGDKKTHVCSVCGYVETQKIPLSNIISSSTVTASEPKNEWAPISNMNDGDESSMYMSNMGDGTYAEFAFDTPKYVKDFSIVLSNYKTIDWIDAAYKNQTVCVSIYKDGEWMNIGTWENNSTDSTDSTIKVSFDVKMINIEKIKVEFTFACVGAASIYEATASGN